MKDIVFMLGRVALVKRDLSMHNTKGHGIETLVLSQIRTNNREVETVTRLNRLGEPVARHHRLIKSQNSST
ncbi:hypothetical protein NI382_15405 [Vibrio parahaemolyticus]|nr:hypothetical protein NI382_15405 [Vibrio parahaemolyticus]